MLSAALQERIRQRPDLWREVCLRSLELLEGTDTHVDRVLALYRDPASTREQFRDAANTADYAANYAANAAAGAAATANYAAAAATANYAANYAAANAAYTAYTAKAKGSKVKLQCFIADLELLVRFAPMATQLNEERAVI